MSKSTQNEQEFIYSGKRNCKLAYALGHNGFTALCNIIDHSPLFYTDVCYDEDYLEEEFMELEELRAELLEGASLEAYKEKEIKKDRAGRHLEQYKKQSIEDLLRENSLSVCERGHDKKMTMPFESILEIAKKSRLATELLDFASSKGVEFALSAQIYHPFYDREAGCIIVNDTKKLTTTLMGLFRALREVWHHKNGVLIHPLTFHPDDAILLNRLTTSDIIVNQCRMAWELKLSGYDDIWTELMGTNAYDLSASFGKEAIADFRSLNNGAAARACFDAWFLSGRCKNLDRKLVQTMLADHNGLVFDNPETSRTASHEIVAALGEMPSGKNYLSGLTSQLIEDPLYAEVRDRSNANFLWFIKFERSFRDSEQNLQEKSNLKSEGSSDASFSQGLNNEQDSANVVEFTRVPAETQQSEHAADNETADDMATIYYINHFKKPSQHAFSSEER